MKTATRRTVLSCALALLLFPTCSQTSFVDGQGRRTGFRWYDPKPHLLVKRSQKTKAILESTVEILPDMDRPQFVTHRGGLGSGGFAVETQNGVLTKFSQNAKDAGPSTLNKLSAAFKSFADHELASRKARDELRAAKQPDPGEDVDVENEMKVLGSMVRSLTDDSGAKALFTPREGADPFADSPAEQLAGQLEAARRAVNAYLQCLKAHPGKAEKCAEQKKAAYKAVKEVDRWLTIQLLSLPVTLDAQKRMQGLKEHVAKLMAALGPPKTSVDKYGSVAIYYELYEMEICDGKVVGLHRVPAETVCRLIQCARVPESVQACVPPSK